MSRALVSLRRWPAGVYFSEKSIGARSTDSPETSAFLNTTRTHRGRNKKTCNYGSVGLKIHSSTPIIHAINMVSGMTSSAVCMHVKRQRDVVFIFSCLAI